MLRIAGEFLDRVESAAMIFFMALATSLTSIQVFFRYVLNDSIWWAEEVVLYGIICMSFIGASMGVRYGAHISVDLLRSLLPPTFIRAFQIVSGLLGVVFAVALAYYGGKLFFVTLGRGQMSPALRIPVAWVYLPIATAGLCLLLRYLQVLQWAWKGTEPDTVVDGKIVS